MSPKRITVDDEPDFPITLRSLRLGLAGRLGRPLKQDQIADMVGVSRSHWSNIERGHEKAGQFLLSRIADALKLDIQLVRLASRGSLAKLDDEIEDDKRVPTKTTRRKKKP